MGIGTNIKQIRTSKGMSISELSSLAGVSKSYISSLERDLKQNPSITILERIADVLDEDLIKIIDDNEAGGSLNVEEEWIEFIQVVRNAGLRLEDLKELLDYIQWKDQKRGMGQ